MFNYAFNYVGFTLLAMVATAAGVQELAGSASQKGTKAVDAPKDAPLKLVGQRSAIQTQRFVVVRDTQALDALLKEHSPHGELDTRTVDFRKQTVIAYFAGRKSSGGYSVELIGVDRKKEAATVKFRLMKPGPGSMVTMALTSPFLIQAVDKLPAKVTHTVAEQERK